MSKLFLPVAVACLLGAAVAVPPPHYSPWPNSYFALGDSFASGLGAGKFFKPEDIENKQCARFDKSYPVIARSLDIFKSVPDEAFRFVACSGDVLDDIDRQRAQLSRAEVITLTIGGNDFDFGEVVKACVFNLKGDAGNQECDDALAVAATKLNDPAIWDKYKRKVKDIIANNLVEDTSSQLWSVLVIAGMMPFIFSYHYPFIYGDNNTNTAPHS